MTQKITVVLEDDLDGGPAAETVRFALDGSAYEIDLSTKHARALRRKLEPFTSQARQAGRGPRRRAGRITASRDRSDGIRAWAKAGCIAVSDRGHIPASVAEQYQAAWQRRLTSAGTQPDQASSAPDGPGGSDSQRWHTIPASGPVSEQLTHPHAE